MARISDEELKALLQRAGGARLVHQPVAGQHRARNPDYDPLLAQTDKNYGEYLPETASIQQWVSPEGYVIQAARMSDGSWELLKDEPAKPDTTPRSPEQARNDQAVAQGNENKNTQEVRDNNERSWNADPANKYQGGSGLPETHLQKAEREAKLREEKLRQEQADRQAEDSRRATQAQKDANDIANRRLTQDSSDNAANRGLTQQQIDIQRQREDREASKPNYLSTADEKNKYVVRADAQGNITSTENPNYSQVKADAEEKRAEFATLIASRRMTLDEAQAQYTQWFETNVKTPLALAQEARAKAEEQRQALEAEERRKQFAADFGLRKATLGESASQRATNAEISLLPYRAGPTESAEMSSAINSLAAGGKIGGPDASAGVNFTAGAFQFNAPDFDGIAKKAAHQVLSGLTDYRPSDQKFATGDYSGVPAVNTSGMPSLPAVGAPYQYTPQPLPAPSPGNG